MKVILLEAIDKLGKIGDVVTVKEGFARNFLIPNKKARPATAGNMKVLDSVKKKEAAETAKQVEEARAKGDPVLPSERLPLHVVAAEELPGGARLGHVGRDVIGQISDQDIACIDN